MIIDCHTHIFESLSMFPKVWLDSLYRSWEANVGKEEANRRMAGVDGRVETLIRDMDEAGVDKSITTPLDFARFCSQEPEMSIWRANEYIAESQRKYTDRIIGFVGVDPQRKNAIELLEKGITEWGLKGVKIGCTDYYLTDEEAQPFMAKANELELPVILHMGSDPPPYLIKYGNPEQLDVLAQRYPKIKFIAAHGARGWTDLLIQIIHYREGKVYTDISGWQHDYHESPWHFLIQMRYLMDRIPRSVFMGTDWPFLRMPPLPIHKEWFDVIRNLKILDQLQQLGIRDFSQDEKDMILGENAKPLLGIE